MRGAFLLTVFRRALQAGRVAEVLPAHTAPLAAAHRAPLHAYRWRAHTIYRSWIHLVFFIRWGYRYR